MERILPTGEELAAFFRRHHGDPMRHGWRVRLMHKFHYFSSEKTYQFAIDRLVAPDCRWIDVGGGKSVFPQSQKLSYELANRCSHLVGVDPSDNLDQNQFVNERAKTTIEEFESQETYDLATFRMVAEHIQRPEMIISALERLIRPGGRVVIYTPNRWSPCSIAASLIPDNWHHYLTHLLWSTEQEDVFPTFYKMNTRKRLSTLFEKSGFKEISFAYLDNCSVFQRFRVTCFLELCVWTVFNLLRVTYPENDLLGVYEKT